MAMAKRRLHCVSMSKISRSRAGTASHCVALGRRHAEHLLSKRDLIMPGSGERRTTEMVRGQHRIREGRQGLGFGHKAEGGTT